MMSWKTIVLGLALGATGLPPLAAAKPCGDNIRGQDIACDCGDIVVSDTVLGNDPVTRDTCSGNALILRADTSRSLSLDLHGATLRGSGTGAGIMVLYGGRGGAHVFSSGGKANITGFNDGVQAHGRNALKLLSDINITEPKRDGVRVMAGHRYRVTDVYVRDAGRNGFWLSGKRFLLRKTKALNSKGTGYVVMGERATLGSPGNGVVSLGSGNAGITLLGGGHRLVDCVAEAAGKNGITFNTSGSVIYGCRAVGNGKDGISGTGGRLRLVSNRAEENVGSGIKVRGHQLQDQGGNRGDRNHLGSRARASMQCQIGGAPCH